MKTNSYIAFFVGLMVNAVLFGVGAVTVLSVPALNVHAKFLIPAVVFVSFAMTPFIARHIAPRLRLRSA